MSEEMNTAFLLMGVGMITVFVVLLCVVIVGKVLIRFVNKYVPIIETKTVASTGAATIPGSKVAAITSAVEIFTKGKGQITSINKI